MLKSTYNRLEDIPEADRPHYTLKKGVYVLELDKDHPVLKKKDELLATNSSMKTKVDELSTQNQSLSNKVLPDGHVAIPKDKASLVTTFEAFGDPKDIKRKLEEHGILLERETSRKREDHLASVGKVMGWDESKTRLLLPTISGIPDLEIRSNTAKNDKGEDVTTKVVVAKVKQSDNTFIERPFTDVIANNPQLEAMLPALAPAKSDNANQGNGQTHSRQIPPQSFGGAPAPQNGGAGKDPVAGVLSKYVAPGAKQNTGS